VCARGDGIRGSKDLRAEFGKYSNSTNERKQMSKKTIKQRIALVAATALGTGVLTVIAVTPANAQLLTRDELTASTTFVSGQNVGVCFVADTTADGADATNTVEMLSTGLLRLTTVQATSQSANDIVSYTITGPAVWDSWDTTAGVLGASVGTPTLSATGKVLSFTAATTFTSSQYLRLKPTGVGTIQVTSSHYISASPAASADTTTQIEVITIASKTACATGTADTAAGSFVRLVSNANKGSTIAHATGTSIDGTDAGYAGNGGKIYVRVDMYDANGTAVPDGVAAGAVTAEVTGNATIGAAGAGTTATAYSTDKSTYFQIAQGTENEPWKGTITVKFNGAVVATKSAVIHGAPASIEVSGIDIPAQDGAATTAGDFVIKDSAGNALDVNISGFATLTEKQGAILTYTAVGRDALNTAARQAAGTTKGTFNVTCTSGYGPGATVTGLKLRYTNAALVSIYSPEFSITCGESSYTYSASLDKASYVPGDIATLTVTSKGAFGNVVKDGQALSTQAAGMSIAGSNLTAVTAPTVTDTFTAGVKTYKFVVGSTEGSYNLVVDLSSLNSSSKPQSAVTIPYKISTGVTTVSNADVLKSIVALIASINKQIQALQKLILKR